ncbi:hypothetical protein NDU88_000443 [Pleurodeles waltl]|uniref:SAP domain-containing protein n=1 Tax=Pleurodeles waltl TaxID=8319 RepID=A0AAV7VTH3_PLEWA|nr:hypothetical protein NDU88_000443 [Pleurodeles waltl]
MAVTSVTVRTVTASVHSHWLLGPIGSNVNQCSIALQSSTAYRDGVQRQRSYLTSHCPTLQGTMELDLASLPTLTVVQLRGLCIERGLPATTNLRKEILIKSLTAWAEAQEVETEEAPEEEEKGEDANSNHSGEGRHPNLSEEEEERSSVDTVTRGRPKASGRKGVLSGGENPSIRERELEAQLAYIALEADKLALEKKK